MEEVLVVLIQLFFEVGVQFFTTPAVDFSFGRGNRGCGIVMLHGVLGGGLGWISAQAVPHLLLPTPGLRMLNLMFAPMLAAVIAWLFAKHLTKQDADAAALHGSLFALMFGLARFGFGNR